MLDYDWCDLDFAPLPVFDSESESELIDDESDTIFECKNNHSNIPNAFYTMTFIKLMTWLS